MSKEIFSFSKEEKETNARFDYEDQCWYVETSVPSHMTRILKLYPEIAEVLTVTESGSPTSIRVRLDPNQIGFRSGVKPIMSEERKQELSARMKNMRPHNQI
ncbi:MAG: hypothetical protein LBH89_02950 [Lactococcus lactis]|jgi:hypothetical protein|nr:hypothetical protein [Lactococcus lactis]